MGWIGVDLDGTLAEYTEWAGPEVIGPPVPAMLERVEKWISEGRDVRIYTARVGHDNEARNNQAADVIIQWCREHLGCVLPITCKKDFEMIELWDDRCVQVEPNTGRRVDGRES